MIYSFQWNLALPATTYTAVFTIPSPSYFKKFSQFSIAQLNDGTGLFSSVACYIRFEFKDQSGNPLSPLASPPNGNYLNANSTKDIMYFGIPANQPTIELDIYISGNTQITIQSFPAEPYLNGVDAAIWLGTFLGYFEPE